MGLHKHLHSASFYIGVFPVLYLLYSTALSRFLLVIGWVGGFKGYGVFYKCIAPFRCNRSASFLSVCFFFHTFSPLQFCLSLKRNDHSSQNHFASLMR